jgi:hypothetical protein
LTVPGTSRAGFFEHALCWSKESMSSKTRILPALPLAALMALLLSASAPAQEPAGAASSSSEEEALAVLNRAAAFYRGQDAFQARARLEIDASGGKSGPLSQLFDLAFERPARYVRAARPPMQVPNTTLFVDGYVIESSAPAFYVKTNAYDSFEEFLERDALPWNAMGFDQLVADDPAAAFLGEGGSAALVGTEEVAGRKAFHLAFALGGDGGGAQHAWFAAEGDPLLLKGARDAGGKEFMAATYSGWAFGEGVDQAVYAFEAPPMAYRVQDPAQALMDPAKNPYALQGMMAPVPARAAEKFRLLTRGRVVLMPFWTFFAEPGTPGEKVNMETVKMTKRLLERFGGEGLGVLGVHVGGYSGALDVEARQAGADFPWLHDPNAEYYRAFRLHGMPTAVLLDPYGRVQAVYAGWWEGLEKMIADDLEALVAGRFVHGPRDGGQAVPEGALPDEAIDPAAENAEAWQGRLLKELQVNLSK